jgi:hypothetical protein
MGFGNFKGGVNGATAATIAYTSNSKLGGWGRVVNHMKKSGDLEWFGGKFPHVNPVGRIKR